MTRSDPDRQTLSAISRGLLLVHGERAPDVDPRPEAIRALFAIARTCSWSVGDIHALTYPMSFHWVAIETRDGAFAIMFDEFFRVAALSRTVPDYRNLAFLDDPRLEEAAAQADAPFRVLPATGLNASLTDADRAFVAGLGAQYASDLKYWKPQTVGDVIFNWWD